MELELKVEEALGANPGEDLGLEVERIRLSKEASQMDEQWEEGSERLSNHLKPTSATSSG